MTKRTPAEDVRIILETINGNTVDEASWWKSKPQPTKPVDPNHKPLTVTTKAQPASKPKQQEPDSSLAIADLYKYTHWQELGRGDYYDEIVRITSTLKDQAKESGEEQYIPLLDQILKDPEHAAATAKKLNDAYHHGGSVNEDEIEEAEDEPLSFPRAFELHHIFKDSPGNIESMKMKNQKLVILFKDGLQLLFKFDSQIDAPLSPERQHLKDLWLGTKKDDVDEDSGNFQLPADLRMFIQKNPDSVSNDYDTIVNNLRDHARSGAKFEWIIAKLPDGRYFEVPGSSAARKWNLTIVAQGDEENLQR